MSWLERTIAKLSPSWGARRALSRVALREVSKLSGLRDASPRSHDAPIYNRGTSMDRDLELGQDRRTIVDRARAADENGTLLGSMLDRVCEAVIGEEGPRLKPRSGDPAWNRECAALWNDWADTPELCDARAIATLPEILENNLRGMLRDGDSLPIQMADGTVRTAESDEISAYGYWKPSMADGVECDRQGRPVAFHVFDYDPDVVWADRRLVSDAQRTRVPSKYCHFLARRSRSNQTRGLSAFNGAFWLTEQFDGTLEAASVGARMGACLGLVINRENPLVNLPTVAGDDGQANSQKRLAPGMILRLKPGEKATQVTPGMIGAPFEAHLRLLVRLCALRLGLPLELALFDFSTANYSNARTVLLQSRKVWKRLQRRVRRLASWLYCWKVITWIEEGRLRAHPNALKHTWQMPGWNWLDPVAELQAAGGRVDLGLATRGQLCAEHGTDFEENLEELKLEEDLAAAAGVHLQRSNLTREPECEASRDGDGAPLPGGARHGAIRLPSLAS